MKNLFLALLLAMIAVVTAREAAAPGAFLPEIIQDSDKERRLLRETDKKFRQIAAKLKTIFRD